jgi:hypothetical protein
VFEQRCPNADSLRINLEKKNPFGCIITDSRCIEEREKRKNKRWESNRGKSENEGENKTKKGKKKKHIFDTHEHAQRSLRLENNM